MRCLTLASELMRQGACCRFVCREEPGNLIDLIRQRGFDVFPLPPVQRLNQGSTLHSIDVDSSEYWEKDAELTLLAIKTIDLDWLIVDHYSLDIKWEVVLSTSCRHIMVIDDLANRPHQCELLLDQNLGRDRADYAELVPATSTVLTGPMFALLEPPFSKLRDFSLTRRKHSGLNSILITMGGVDANNATSLVLESLMKCPLPSQLKLTIVMGQHAPHREQVMHLAKSMPWSAEVLVNVSNMAELMAQSDLAIGAAGTTSWERCCLGLPTLLLVLADNQVAGANALQKSNSAILLSDLKSIDAQLLNGINLVATPQVLENMIDSSAQVTDGLGTIRVIEKLTTASSARNFK